MPLRVIRRQVARRYENFSGIDLLNPETSILPQRSPDCLNVWKSYDTEQSNIIQTRPGIKEFADFSESEANNTIYTIYDNGGTMLVHRGIKLIKNGTTPSTLYSSMAERKSTIVYFKGVQILDGTNYLNYNGTNVTTNVGNGTIPTTTIGRSPSGGGEMYQDVNLLTSQRKNTFIGDGSSKDFYLDAVDITSVDTVKVNGTVLTSGYSVTAALGKITFTTAPSAPSIIGQDNVEITFTKTISGYSDRISKCTLMKVFDNRLFFSGNPDYPNAVFHSELNDPYYVSDLSYYECGTSENPIKSMVVGNNLLWIFKLNSVEKDTIFYLTPTLDLETGKVYPTKQGNVSVGCYSKATNYKDTLLFFSKTGLEGISGNIDQEQSITHKSSLVDSKLINMSNYAFLNVAEYKGYLVVAIDNTLFLADHRQLFAGTTGYEYEWYLWELPKVVTSMLEIEGDLYFGTGEGKVYWFDGTNDLNLAIDSYWTTPRDDFGYMQHLKKINKRGAIAKMKNLQNSRLKIWERTNKSSEWKLVKELSTSGFSYDNMDYANFTYVLTDNTYVVFKVKEKKIIDLSLKIGSDVLDKPFGLDELNIEAFISGYVKRS